MKADVTEETKKQLKEITATRKNLGRSDWASHHILAPLIAKLHKKECKQ